MFCVDQMRGNTAQESTMKSLLIKYLIKVLRRIELYAAYWQGKGWGVDTVHIEFSHALSLLDDPEVKLCIDIGGNKGTYTDEIIQQRPQAEVIIFEPAHSNIEVLKQRFGQNNKITVEPFAIFSSTGTATLHSNTDGSGLASLTKRRLQHFNIDFELTEEIRTITFEDYWKNQPDQREIDICKIDIEGHELDALIGFGDMIRKVRVFQFEFGGGNVDTRTYFQDFWYLFQKHNFEIYRITPLGLVRIEAYREHDEFFLLTNYLARRMD